MKMLKNLSLSRSAIALAVAGVFSAGSAQAAVSSVGSQAAFSALGTISQNTNWDSYGAGFFFPGSPFTVGDLTFVEGSQNLIGGTGTGYDLARNLFTDNGVQGTTAITANTYNMFAVNAGNFFVSGAATFSISTNLGSYTFSEFVGTATNQAALTFVGYQAGAGEYFTSVSWSGVNATGVTDIQLGVTAVPEPETYAMLLAGLGLLGFVARRRQRKLAAA